jgi:hypothetical protein
VAYTAVKLADITKAVTAVKDAQTAYDNATKNSAPKSAAKVALDTATKRLEDARGKLGTLQSDFDNQKFAQAANVVNASKLLGKSQSFLDNQEYLKAANIVALQKAIDTAKTPAAQAAAQKKYDLTVSTAEKAARTDLGNKQKGYDTVFNAAQLAAQKAIDTQANLINGAKNKSSFENQFNTAQGSYQKILDSMQPSIDARNQAISNVANYAQTIKDSFGDVNNIADAKAVEKLLKDANTAIGGLKLPELQDQFKTTLGDFDPIKSFNEKLPALQEQYKQSFELPTLSASQVDKALKDQSNVLNRNAPVGDGNTLLIPSLQGMGDVYLGKLKVDGLNLKSVNANISTGAALFGLTRRQLRDDKKSIHFSGDFDKAAEAAKVDITGMTKQQAYDAINEKGQGYYQVSSRGSSGIDPATGKEGNHWVSFYKKEGDQLVPLADQNGQKIVQTFSADWAQDEGNWYDSILQIAPIVLPFVLPGIGNAISTALGNTIISAAVAPTAFTVGLPAVTLSSVVGNAAVVAAGNSISNAIVTKLVNPDASAGDLAKAMATGAAVTIASGNASKIVENLGISSSTVDKIAEASNLTSNQVKDLIATGVTNTVSAAVTSDPNALLNIASNVGGQFVGSQAQNLVADALENADTKLLYGAVDIAGNAANVATQTLMQGGDLNAALINAAPSILSSGAKAASVADKTTKTQTIADKTASISDAEPSTTATQEFPVQDRLNKDPSTMTNEARTWYENAIEGGLDEQNALIYANIIEDRIKNPNAYSGVQFGPELALLSPDNTAYKKFNAFRKENAAIFNENSTASDADFWEKANEADKLWNAAVEEEISKGADSRLQLMDNGSYIDPKGGEFTNVLTGEKGLAGPQIYFKNADGNWQVRDVEGQSVTGGTGVGTGSTVKPDITDSGTVTDAAGNSVSFDPQGNLTGSSIKSNLAALFSTGTNSPTASGSALFGGSGASTYMISDDGQHIYKFASKNPEAFDLIAKDTYIKNNIPEYVDVTSLDPVVQQKVKDELIAKVTAAEKAQVAATNTPSQSGGGGGGSTVTTQVDDSSSAPVSNVVTELTPQQKADELQKQADAAQAAALETSNNYIQNPTVENKAIADKHVLDAEISIRMANAAKANLTGGDIPKSNAGQSLDLTGGQTQTGSGAGQQTDQAASTTPGTSTLPGDGTSSTTGLGGTGSGTGLGDGVGSGTGSGTGSGIGTGIGSGIGAGVGSGTGALSTIPPDESGGKVPENEEQLTEILTNYATNTPFAKRPIGDLYPLSHTMMTPEEIAARSTTKMVRRGGLVSVR